MSRLLAVIVVVALAVSCRKTDQPMELYAFPYQVSPGETVQLVVKQRQVPLTEVRLYDMQGQVVFTQPNPGESDTITLAAPNLPNGLYRWENKAPMVITDNTVEAKIAVMVPFNTWNAYCFDGPSLYRGLDSTYERRARKVSFQRCIQVDQYSRGFFKWYPTTPFYKQSVYLTERNVHDNGIPAGIELLIIPGHSEYWSQHMRNHIAAYNAKGGRILVLSGNTCYWKVDYEGEAMVCAKTSDDRFNRVGSFSKPDSIIPNASPLYLLGAAFEYGGYADEKHIDRVGFEVLAPEHDAFTGTGLERGDILAFGSSEVDGVPIVGFDAEGRPVVDTVLYRPYRFEVLAWSKAVRDGEKIGVMVEFQACEGCGVVVNVGSTDWCGEEVLGDRQEDLGRIISALVQELFM